MYDLSGKIILLNAPPGAGKDTVAEAITRMSKATRLEFKDSLFRIAKSIANISNELWNSIYTRELKEQPSDLCFGLSPRDLLIKTSEEVVKPNFGVDFFGLDAAKKVEEVISGGAVFSDSGFVEETQSLIDKFGAENIFIVQFTGQGKTSFEGDSRNWLPVIKGVKTLITTNDERPEDCAERICKRVTEEAPRS